MVNKKTHIQIQHGFFAVSVCESYQLRQTGLKYSRCVDLPLFVKSRLLPHKRYYGL